MSVLRGLRLPRLRKRLLALTQHHVPFSVPSSVDAGQRDGVPGDTEMTKGAEASSLGVGGKKFAW